MNQATKKAIPTALSIVAGVGVVVTAVTAARGHVRALDILAQHEIPEDTETREAIIEAAKLTWKEYLPPVISGAVTIGCIVGANGMHLKEEAALAALVGVFGARLKNMDKEVLKKYGKETLDTMRKDILAREVTERADKILATAKKQTAPDEKVYYEPFTGQPFLATEEDIKDAELQLNDALTKYRGSVTLDEFIDMLPKKAKLKTPNWTSKIGWFPGDEGFEWHASFESGDYVALNPTEMYVKKINANANVLQYSIYPMEPSDDYLEIIKGNKQPYIFYPPEPEDMIEFEEPPVLEVR